MTITITLNGVKVKRNIPTNWDQITFRNLVDLKTIGADNIGVISYFTNIDKDTLKKAKVINFEIVLSSLSFLFKDPDTVQPPSYILGCRVPQSLDDLSIEQFENFKEALAKTEGKTEDDKLRLFPKLLAIVVMPEYDWKKVDDFSERFWDAPCLEVVAIVSFFLKRLNALTLGSKTTSPQGVTVLRKLMLVIQSWLINLAFSLRWYSWKHKHRIDETNSKNGV